MLHTHRYLLACHQYDCPLCYVPPRFQKEELELKGDQDSPHSLATGRPAFMILTARLVPLLRKLIPSLQ